jgi:hypothetical protein
VSKMYKEMETQMTTTYTPMGRADFAAVGIARKRCCINGSDLSGAIHVPCRKCYGVGFLGPDVTGVLCNREPATTQEETEAAVEWLAKYGPAFYMLAAAENGDPHTRILHIRPVEAIDILGYLEASAGGVGSWKTDGLLITGGDVPLEAWPVSYLIEQANGAGVPIYIADNCHWVESPDHDPHEWLDIVAQYRNLPASMMGGRP